MSRSVTLTIKNKNHMKHIILCISGMALAAFISGCAVPQSYTKTVTTTLDGSGNVTGTVITETIYEAHNKTPRVQDPPSSSVPLKNIQK